jgi:hypothetical protein
MKEDCGGEEEVGEGAEGRGWLFTVSPLQPLLP